MKTSKFKLCYRVVNGGDGSAYPEFTRTESEAEAAEISDIEDGMDGWGEPSAGYVELRINDGVIEFRKWENAVKIWIPLENSK